ncbi:hypothetical protein MUP01_12840, partial [Candidatus Bathyarchaeota archaeon]|nr:hypothetical protein [Candidatus Bathyarchaeota archaeon]
MINESFKNQECTEFSYHTIQNPKNQAEFEKVMDSAVSEMRSTRIQKVSLGSHSLTMGNPIYVTEKLSSLFGNAEITQTQVPESDQGVSREWRDNICFLEIDVAFAMQAVSKSIADISNKSINHKTLLSQMIDQGNQFTAKYKKLIQTYKSLRSRKISDAKSLHATINQFYELIREVQTLSNITSEKEAFAIKTQITRNARHNDSLFRRLVKNKEKFSKEEEPFSFTLTDNKITATKDQVTKTYELVSSLDTLNSTFKCFWTLAEWNDIVEEGTVFGLPVSYNWKDNDDWAPSKAYVNIPESGLLISLQGMEESQMDIFSQNPLHENLYNAKNPFLKLFGDTKYNSLIPLATDPTILDKFPVTRNYLSGVITGSEYGFRNQHVLYYISILKQLLNMQIDNDTEHTRHMILLTLNTFRILSSKFNLVFEKDDKAVSQARMLYYISIGDTNRHYFASGFDSAIMALVASDKNYQAAHEIYKQEQKSQITFDNFKIKIWEMVFRNIWLHAIDTSDLQMKSWTSPFSWGIPDEKIVAKRIQAEGDSALKDLILTNEKINNSDIPSTLQATVLGWQKNHKLVKLFLALVEIADSTDSVFWDKFNRSFLFTKLTQSGLLTEYFKSPKIIQDLLYWTSWEKNIYGEKDCYPYRNAELVIPHIVNRVNAYFTGDLRALIKDIQELELFNT